MNDWDLVLHQKYLSKVPAKVTVSHIIEQYVTHLGMVETASPLRCSVASEVIKGLGEYFNLSLGPQFSTRWRSCSMPRTSRWLGQCSPVIGMGQLIS